jgi:hypothetical protein
VKTTFFTKQVVLFRLVVMATVVVAYGFAVTRIGGYCSSGAVDPLRTYST